LFTLLVFLVERKNGLVLATVAKRRFIQNVRLEPVTPAPTTRATQVFGFLRDSVRNLMVRGPLMEVGLCPRSDEEEFLLARLSLLALLADEDRALVSANTSSKLALAWERGMKELSRISTNFDSVMLLDRLDSVQRERWMHTRPARSALILSTIKLRE